MFLVERRPPAAIVALVFVHIFVIVVYVWDSYSGKDLSSPRIAFQTPYPAQNAVVREHSYRNEGILSYSEGYGRLGNWLFQYASAFGIAEGNNQTLVISQNNALRRTFTALSAQVATSAVNTSSILRHYERQSMVFTPSLLHLQGNVHLCCYLQSWRYFEGIENAIRRQFTFKDAVRSRAEKHLSRCQRSYEQTFNATSVLVGVHVRRRDVTTKAARIRGFLPAPLTFIQRAMTLYEQRFEHVVFVLASDDNAWCERNFKTRLKTGSACLGRERSAIDDLCVLTQCNHSIITVGSFGWWSAFLTGGHVLYFNQWPRNGSEMASHFDKRDYFPPHWEGLS